MKPLLVLKLGTSSITHSNGMLNFEILENIGAQIAQLHQKYHLIVVSSGAVGNGKKFLKNFTGKLNERKAAAAVGNPILIRKYAEILEPYQIPVAQILSERQHFANREQFLQLRATFEELWKNGILPIVNENDVVSNFELKFSDNDELATLIAVGFLAEKLLLGTSVEGVLNTKGERIPRIENFDESIFGLAKSGTSDLGLGGMISKLHFANKATRLGIEVIIFNAKEKNSILLAENHQTGTHCPAKKCDLSCHHRWMATGGRISAKISIDSGAAEALRNRKSLLLVGVQTIEGEFEKGEIFEIYEKTKNSPIAIGRAKISSREILELAEKKGTEIAHTNEIVIF